MNIILEYAVALIFPLLVILGTGFFLFKVNKIEKFKRIFISQKILFAFLILWTLFGFFSQQDFIENCGCFVYSRDIFSPGYVIFSSITLTILLIGVFTKNKTFRIVLVSIELTYWIFKLFILKSGYIGGLGLMVFKYYDFYGLLGRLLLLNSLLGRKLRAQVMSLVAGVLIIIKMLVIPCNENDIYESYMNSYYTKLMFKQLNGHWNGSLLYLKDSSIVETIENPDTVVYVSVSDVNIFRDTTVSKSYKKIGVHFNDSSLTIENSAPELNGKYSLTYSQPEFGFLVYIPNKFENVVKRDYMFKQFEIKVIFDNMIDNTLSFTIDNRSKFKLKRSR